MRVALRSIFGVTFGVTLTLGLLACGDDKNGNDEVGDGDGDSTEGDGDGDPGDGDPGDGDGDPGDGDGEPGDGDGEPGDGDGDGDGDPADCGPLGEPPPEGPIVQVDPSMAGTLPQLVADAEPNTTFEFADGTYDLSSANLLHVTTPGLRFVGAN